MLKILNIGGKCYRPFTYKEAKEKILGKAIDFVQEYECEDCGDIHDYESSLLVTHVDEDGFIIEGIPVPYTHAVLLFSFPDGSPLGVEVEVKDVEPKKAKPAPTTSAKKSPRKKRETKAKAEE